MAGPLPPVVAELLATNGQFMAKMAESKAAMEDVSKSGKSSFSTLSAVGGKMLGGLAIGAAAIGAASVAMSIKFQDAMEQIHTQAGASQAEVEKLSGAVLNLAGPVATAPNELAAGLYHLESQGLRGAKAMDALKVSAEGAKIGHANLEDVTNALGAAISSGISGVQNYTQAMGEMNAVVGAGDMRMQDLAEAMGGGVVIMAKQAGLSLTDVGAAFAVFGDNMIRGSKAGIYLRQTIANMERPSQNAVNALASIGIKSTEMADDLRKPNGLLFAMEDLRAHLKQSGLDATQTQQLILEAFGGAKSGAGVAILVGELDKLKSKYAAITDGANNFGSDWQAQQKTAQFQLDQLGASMEATGIKIGNALLPKLETLAQDLQKTVIWFENNKGAAEAIGGTLAALAGTLATIWAVDKINGWVNAVKGAITWVTNLGKAAVITAGEEDALGGKGGLVPIGGGAKAGAGALATGEKAAGLGAIGATGTVIGVAAMAAAAAIIVHEIINEKNTPIGKKPTHPISPGGGTAIAGGQTNAVAAADWFFQSKNQLSASQWNAANQQAADKDATKGNLAKDSTALRQIGVLGQMEGQLSSDSAKFGANSVQAHSDRLALASTANKWGLQHAGSLKAVDGSMKSSYLQLLSLNAVQGKLQSSGSGNLEQSKYIKAVLENTLSHAKSVLAKDETAHASKQAIDQAKQKISDTQGEIGKTTNHIDQLKAVAGEITTTKDTLSSQQKLSSDLGKLNTDTSALKSMFGTGIPISKLPDKNTKLLGSIVLKVT